MFSAIIWWGKHSAQDGHEHSQYPMSFPSHYEENCWTNTIQAFGHIHRADLLHKTITWRCSQTDYLAKRQWIAEEEYCLSCILVFGVVW